MHLRTLIAVLFVLLSAPAMAFAQAPDVKELNAEGLRAFGEGRYAEAADIFGRAYALDPRAELLKNEAVAWYRAERCSEAVDAANTFLQAASIEATEARQMRSLMGACKVRLAEEAVAVDSLELAEKLLAEVEASNPDATIADRVSVVRIQIAKKRAPEPDPEPEPTAEPLPPPEAFAENEPAIAPTELDSKLDRIAAPLQPEPRSNKLAGSLTTTGGALLVGGLVYHIVAKTSIESEFKEVAAGGDRNRYDALDKSLKLANVAVPTLYLLGAVSLGTGIYLYARPAPSNEGAVVGLRGTF